MDHPLGGVDGGEGLNSDCVGATKKSAIDGLLKAFWREVALGDNDNVAV